MRYSELTPEAQNNAILDYCNHMNLTVKDWGKYVIKWFNKYNRDILTEEGFLKYKIK